MTKRGQRKLKLSAQKRCFRLLEKYAELAREYDDTVAAEVDFYESLLPQLRELVSKFPLWPIYLQNEEWRAQGIRMRAAHAAETRRKRRELMEQKEAEKRKRAAETRRQNHALVLVAGEQRAHDLARVIPSVLCRVERTVAGHSR